MLVAPVLAELPRVAGVGKVGFESFGDDACLEFRVEYGKRHFNAAKQISAHPVRAGEIDVLFPVVLEIPYAVMLEKSADDGAHANTIRNPFDPRTQAASAADYQIDLDTCL